MERRDDSPEAMREWRWRAYRDHLEDLGYDLDGGTAFGSDRGLGRSVVIRRDAGVEPVPVTIGGEAPQSEVVATSEVPPSVAPS